MTEGTKVITTTTHSEKFIIAVAINARMRKIRANTLAILQSLSPAPPLLNTHATH